MPHSRTWLYTMTVVMATVTIWSSIDGQRGPALIAVAVIATIAALQVLAHLTFLLPPTRLTAALFSATWVFLFGPSWDWLAGQFTYPDTLRWWAFVALGFGAFRYLITPGGLSRPPK